MTWNDHAEYLEDTPVNLQAYCTHSENEQGSMKDREAHSIQFQAPACPSLIHSPAAEFQ